MKLLTCIITIPFTVSAACIRGGDHGGRKSIGCPEGGISNKSGEFCCPQACGNCGGHGCEARPGGEMSCCTSKVTSSCADNVLPCKIPVSDQTDPPTVEVTESPTGATVCSNGKLAVSISFLGYCNVEVCCPSSCSICDTSAECTDPVECCAQKIAEPIFYSDLDVSCRSNEPPCVVPPTPDPCDENPCQNGGTCSVSFQLIAYVRNGCNETVTCICSEEGNGYVGQFCETACSEGEAACGFWDVPGGYHWYNDVCCSAGTSECVNQVGKYGYSYQCFPVDRPTSCDPNPCLNGGSCYNYSYYGPDPLYGCICTDGFEGTYCETVVV